MDQYVYLPPPKKSAGGCRAPPPPPHTLTSHRQSLGGWLPISAVQSADPSVLVGVERYSSVVTISFNVVV